MGKTPFISVLSDPEPEPWCMVSLRFPVTLWDRVAEVAKSTHHNKTQVVVRLLDHALEQVEADLAAQPQLKGKSK